MWSLIKHLFNKEAVVSELKAGSIPTERAKNYLLTFLFVSCAGQLPNLVRTGATGLAPFAVMLIVIAALYGLAWMMIEGLYDANGGAKGERFYERLYVLGMSATIRILPWFLGSVLFFTGAMLLFAMWLLMPWMMVLAAVLMMVVLIAFVTWVYRDIRAGLRAVSGTTEPQRQ